MIRNNNHIGCTPGQKKYTNWIARLFPEINDLAGDHDDDYKNLYDLYFSVATFWIYVIKVLYDLKFLIVGSFKTLIRMQLIGTIIVMIMYVILLFTTHWYIKKYIDN